VRTSGRREIRGSGGRIDSPKLDHPVVPDDDVNAATHVVEVADKTEAALSNATRREVQYLVLCDAIEPFLLARVRWPDVFQAISAVRPYWQDDPGLFDLPYVPASVRITREQAEEIAAEWGARIPDEDQSPVAGPQLIRRMPSDWSNLSTAERRAWSLAPVRSRRRAKPVAAPTVDADELIDSAASGNRPADGTVVVSGPKRRRWGRSQPNPVESDRSAQQGEREMADQT
jgi:hypothetical protein